MNDGTARRRYNFNTVAAIVFAVIGVVLFLLAPSQIDEPLIRIGQQSGLSPELFPRLVSAAVVCLAIWYFIRSFDIRQSNELRELDREAVTNVLVTLVIMAGYVLVMINLGFVVGSALMIMVMSTYFGNRNYWLSGIVAVVLPVIVFVLFTKVLITSLPPFPVDELIPESWIIYDPIKFISNQSII